MKLSKLKINLLSKEALEEKALGKFLRWSLTFGRYIIVGTEIIVLLAFFSRFKLDSQLTDLHEEISQKEAIVKFNSDFEKEARIIQQQLKEVKGLEESHDLGVKLLNYFEKTTPKDVAFDRLSLSQEKISLSGASVTTSSFINLLAQFRNSGKFSQVVLESLSKKGEETLEFKLSAKINKENFY